VIPCTLIYPGSKQRRMGKFKFHCHYSGKKSPRYPRDRRSVCSKEKYPTVLQQECTDQGLLVCDAVWSYPPTFQGSILRPVFRVMEVEWSSENLISNHNPTWRHNSEEIDVNLHRRENLKPRIRKNIFLFVLFLLLGHATVPVPVVILVTAIRQV
jgi:hypothetical protein